MGIPEQIREILTDSRSEIAEDVVRAVSKVLEFSQQAIEAIGEISVREAKQAIENLFKEELWK